MGEIVEKAEEEVRRERAGVRCFECEHVALCSVYCPDRMLPLEFVDCKSCHRYVNMFRHYTFDNTAHTVVVHKVVVCCRKGWW